MNNIKLYFYGFIFLLITVLGVTVYVQYTDLKSTNTRLEQVEADYKAMSTTITESQANLETLRDDLSTISKQSAQMQKQLKSIPKPTPNADNSKDIQTKSNELSQSIFGQIK